MSLGDDYGYSLYWNRGSTNGNFVKIAYVTDANYTLRTYDASKTYLFKVRACYPCGCGPYSDVYNTRNSSSRNNGFSGFGGI